MEQAHAALESVKQALSRERVRTFLGTHGLPLLIVALAALASLLALLSVHSAVVISPDGKEYLATAQKIIQTGELADPKRTPGYPLFLAVIFAGFPAQNLYVVVTIQLALCCVAAFEVYLLVFRLMEQPWIACAAGVVVGLNIYMLDWAYSIRDESFSFWLTVTLFLAVERLARRPSPAAVTVFTAFSALVIMTRPFYLFLPALLGLALLARGIGLRWSRREALAVCLALAMIYGTVAGYALRNNAVNGYLGLSYVSDANLFGKALEYKMVDRPVPAQFQRIQGQAREFAARGGDLPWTFAKEYGYTADYYHALGVYARYVILHDPAHYAIGTARDAVKVTLVKAGVDARGVNTPGFTLARLVTRAELLTYMALPLVAVWLIWRLWRGGWRDRTMFLAALLILATLGTIMMTAVASYGEFYRLRAPIDWAWLTGLTLVVVDAGRMAWNAWRERARERVNARAAV